MSWPKPTRFTLTFRGNTLADIHPRDTQRGFTLYGDGSLERFRQSAPTRRVTRFVPAER